MRAMKNHIAPLLAVGTFLFASSLLAQDAKKIEFPQASSAASVKERVGVTDVSVEYSRPNARERKIFGGLVPYGQVWRTGANAATKITFSTDVKLGGTAVPAGSYALFTIPGEAEWTVILSKVTEEWGSYAYDPKDDQARVKVKPVAMAEPLETMTIGVQDIRSGKANLVIAWEKTKVPVPIDTDLVAKIKPQIEAAMAGGGDKKPYFAAAMFYYENDLDMAKAKEWIEAAVKEKPDAVWMVYRKGLILKKAGDKDGALAAAKQALELAAKDEGEAKDEYTRLSQALIASLK